MAASIKSAWVITKEGTRQSAEVVGILSGRKSPNTIKEYIEWLYVLLNNRAEEHFSFASYKKHVPTYPGHFNTTNGVPDTNVIMCGGNPYLMARLARNVTLIDSDGDEPVLKWTNPDKFNFDVASLRVVEKISGTASSAPVHLPLCVRG